MKRNQATRPMRVQGKVRAIEGKNPVVARAALSARRHAEHWSAPDVLTKHPFEVVASDGTTYRVDVSQIEADDIVPDAKAQGTWSELRTLPMASHFESSLPGPHVELAMRWAILREGDDVAVEGGPMDAERPRHAGGFREPARRQVRTLRATLVAGGSRPMETLQEAIASRTPGERPGGVNAPEGGFVDWARVCAGTCAIAALLLLACALWRHQPSMAMTQAGSIASLLALALLVPEFSRRGRLEFVSATSRSAESRPAGKTLWHGGSKATIVGLSVLMMPASLGVWEIMTVTFVGAQSPQRSMGLLVGITAVVSCFVGLFGWCWDTHKRNRLLRLILGAPPHPAALQPLAWGSSQGTVTIPNPVSSRLGPVAVSLVTETEVVRGSNPDIVRTSMTVADELRLNTNHGTVEIGMRGALWCSTVRRVQKLPGTSTFRLEMVIPDGAAVMAAGYLREPQGLAASARLEAQGPESLLVFATEAQRNPRHMLGRLILVRRLVTAALLALSIGMAVSTVVFWEQTPALPESSD